MTKFVARCAAALFAAALLFSTRPAGAATNASDRIVVMISVDGLAADYIDDPKAEMPAIRKLAAEGVRAASMKAVTPTVTWPNHTTLVTGDYPARHGVVGNNYLDRETGKKVILISDPVFDKSEIVKVPTIYDVAKSNGLKTAAVRWPATRHAATLDWTTPDVHSGELIAKYTTPALAAECQAAGIDMSAVAAEMARTGDERAVDNAFLRVFQLILATNRPNLALLHLVNVDHTQHLHGPRGAEAYEAVKLADRQVQQVWEQLQRDYPGKATLLVVSDHGFSAINRSLFPNVVLRKAGLADAGKKKGRQTVELVTQGGAAFLYIAKTADRARVTEQVKQAFQGLDGILKVADSSEFKALGVADPANDPHAPDIILFAREGYTFGDTAAGELPFKDKPERRGSHGHDPNIPHLHATFVAWGAGIKCGAKVGEISNLDVAPTIGALLGTPMPDCDGKPLKAILSK
jgi:predicted AlkP superfamily pyrophosphatase or phosphodiesterase